MERTGFHGIGEREARERTALRELGWLFLRLGATAFGGPAAHIAMMQDEVVTRRKWLSEQRFLDMLGATNLIPGPNSTELAIHIGWERRRFAGLLLAGVAFIAPAMLITSVLGFIYMTYRALPAASGLLYGVKPVILGVVVQAIWGLLPRAARSWPLRGLAALAVVLAAVGVHELWVLFGCGAAALLSRAWPRRTRQPPHPTPPSLLWPVLPLASDPLSGIASTTSSTTITATVSGTITATVAASATASVFTLPALFWVFCKIGSVLFGSGYVLLAFLRADLVQRLGWLSEGQLIDAIAVGQVTPGPVFTTATFIGYVLSGPVGALVATAGIFLPAFVFVALSVPLLPRLRASENAAGFLDGVNVASLALMAVVTFQLGRAALIDAPTLLLAASSALLLVRYQVSSTWLVLGGAACGLLLHA